MTGNCGGELSHSVSLRATGEHRTCLFGRGVSHVTPAPSDRNQSVKTKGGHQWKLWVCPTESGRASSGFRKSAAPVCVRFIAQYQKWTALLHVRGKMQSEFLLYLLYSLLLLLLPVGPVLFTKSLVQLISYVQLKNCKNNIQPTNCLAVTIIMIRWYFRIDVKSEEQNYSECKSTKDTSLR